jgi:hypothetical protein
MGYLEGCVFEVASAYSEQKLFEREFLQATPTGSGFLGCGFGDSAGAAFRAAFL